MHQASLEVDFVATLPPRTVIVHLEEQSRYFCCFYRLQRAVNLGIFRSCFRFGLL